MYIYITIIYMYYSMILRRSPQVHYRHAALMNWALLTVKRRHGADAVALGHQAGEVMERDTKNVEISPKKTMFFCG